MTWYITRFGLLYLTMTLAIFLLATHYSNNALFAVFSCCVAIFLTSALRNLFIFRTQTLLGSHIDQGFAGSDISLRLTLDEAAIVTSLHLHNTMLYPAQTSDLHCLQTTFHATKRGLWNAQTLTLISNVPFGLCKRHLKIPVQLQTIIFPTPKGIKEFPESIIAQKGQHTAQRHDIDHLRDYQHGDALADIAWKASARGQGLMVREFDGNSTTQQCIFTLEHTQHLPTLEDRLSQLCLWVLEADKRGISYGLTLGSTQIDIAHGERHRIACLTALALYKES